MGKTVQLTIPKACHENWDKMKPGEQGRHCMSCKKTVIDFTDMSDRAILHHIANAGGAGICGRLHPDQLHRNMIVQKESRLPWLKYFFQFTLPAFLISMKAKGEEPGRKTRDTIIVKQVEILKSPIKGRVLDERGNAVSWASVFIKGTSTGTATDTLGNFSIDWPDKQDAVLSVSGIGYAPLEVKVKAKDRSEINLLRLSLNYAVMGELVVVRRKRVKRIAIEVAPPIIVPDSVKLSPNPVGAGHDINMELNLKQTGKYNIEVYDLSGRMISKKEVRVGSKYFRTGISTENLQAGNYVVTIINNKGKKIAAKKIIVQN